MEQALSHCWGLIFMLRYFLLLILCCFHLQSFADTLITPDVIRNIESMYKGPARARLQEWAKLIEERPGSSDNAKLDVVNRYFNRFEYRSDAEQVGRNDFWMTPVEFITRGGGDCEDYSIAKYFTLQAIGVDPNKMRITYVKYLKQNVAHMVLAYYPSPKATPLILDNLINSIKSADQRTDLVPVYSFNGDGLWLAKQREQGRRVSGSNRVSLWRELNARMVKQLKGTQRA